MRALKDLPDAVAKGVETRREARHSHHIRDDCDDYATDATLAWQPDIEKELAACIIHTACLHLTQHLQPTATLRCLLALPVEGD